MTGRIRERLRIRGLVQGVGFRPHVYRVATECGVSGFVRNSGRGVDLEVEGGQDAVESFVSALLGDLPPNARVDDLARERVEPLGAGPFEIVASRDDDAPTALVLADLATCDACLAEMDDPADRRYRYPFLNCTHCGPRYSIVESLPYDRPHTTMRGFEMCPDCRREYEDPRDRRFHAQPTACPACGPKLTLLDPAGTVLAESDDALRATARAVLDGRVAAVKGLGGFHLLADATRAAAVARLRTRKRRPAKPFAVLFPDLDAVREACEVSRAEAKALRSTRAPIVLLRRLERSKIAAAVAPDNPMVGAMLPYTPLHHLLLREIGRPVVATSGNLSEEPLCFDNDDALRRLGEIADLFLVHDRPIARPVDDSVVRFARGRELPLRRARGYAPLPVLVSENLAPTLAVGGHLKNTVALGLGRHVFLSPHIGDLEGRPSMEAFERNVSCLQSIWEVRDPRLARDLHPDYLSTRWAEERSSDALAVQHHFAHVVACLADNEAEGPVLGLSWDGTGYGPDGTIWGGEFLRATRSGYERLARVRTFPLPGGDAAIREPRRSALGLLYEAYGEDGTREAAALAARSPALAGAFDDGERATLLSALRAGVYSPRTSSVGRLFDAVAALIGVRQVSRFEGEAAMQLEFLADREALEDPYPFPLRTGTDPGGPRYEADWVPLLDALLADLTAGAPPSRMAGRFHGALAALAEETARAGDERRVVLTGGCFQNAVLLDAVADRLEGAGFEVLWHRQVPPNDGGIALGQAVASHAASRVRGAPAD